MDITEEQGIEIYKTAGIDIKVNDFTYRAYRNNVIARVYSCRDWLHNLSFIIKDIQDFAFHDGYNKGYQKLQKQFQDLLTIKE